MTRLLIGEEATFSMVCRLVITSDFQHAVCQLIREIAIDTIFIESSRLLKQIASLITFTPDFFAIGI
jgi:hypothetical protein